MSGRRLKHRFTIVVVVKHCEESKEDAYGNLRFTCESENIGGAVFAPGVSDEHDTSRRDHLETMGTLYFVEEVNISSTDIVQTPDGVEWEVDGEPKVWPSSPFTGALGGMVVQLRKRKG